MYTQIILGGITGGYGDSVGVNKPVGGGYDSGGI